MTEEWLLPERQSLRKSIFLHLAPGVPFTLIFFLVAWLINQIGGSAYLAIIICVPLVLAPVEVGILIAERKKLGWTWRSIIIPHGSHQVSISDILISVVTIYIIAQAASALVIPTRTLLMSVMSQYYPSWAIVDSRLQGIPPYILWLGLFFSGLVAPIVEELYFRAYLLPRIPISGRWAPIVNAAFHSIYHFYTPWNIFTFFMGFLPLAYYVRLRGNLLPTIITHALFNSVGLIIVLAGGVLPW
jgi:membrane protease YdiL (CAAX protease family)